MTDAFLQFGDKRLKLDRPRVMGILNTTPDSFSDGGEWTDADQAIQHVLDMALAGADIIDIGGEWTRPGAQAVSSQEEMDRVIPLIEALAPELSVPLSIDTSKPEVMSEAVRAGAGMINDVCALRTPGALETAARLNVPVCLMHMQGRPRDMQHRPAYQDVVGEVEAFLLERAAACHEAGIPRYQIVIDPGFGFGKNFEHNLSLFKALPRLSSHGLALLAGLSRKSMLGRLTGKPVGERLAASLAAAVMAVQAGAVIVRVHDVAQTVDALITAAALQASI
jgi:dihydropteroate synthase